MTFASVQDLIQGTRQVLDLNGGVRVKDPTALRGETIDRPNYVAHFVDSSPADAIAAHRADIERLRPAHGQPRPVRTMADSLRMDAEYRSRHGGVTLRRLTFSVMGPAFGAAGLAIICGLLLLLGRS